MSGTKDAHSPLLTPTSKTASANPASATSSTAHATKPSGSGSNAPTQSTTPTGNPPPPSSSAVPATKPIRTNLSPDDMDKPRKADTNLSWGSPAGLRPRGDSNENLIIFRKALGINYHRDCSPSDACDLEEGRKAAVGIYRQVIVTQARKSTQASLIGAAMYVCYLSQIVIGAALTALGGSAEVHKWTIVGLGAANTVLAGVLALIKGSGQPLKLSRDAVEYRKLQDWIEETEALLAVGVIGRDRKEVGLLVESAFKRYNAAKASEENNKPDMYINQPLESLGNRASEDMGEYANGGGKTAMPGVVGKDYR